MMVDDFEYFEEFLANPSVPDLNEFYRILRRWGKYLEAHKDEFNYLEDDEWKEIRERLIAELEIRVPMQDDLYDELYDLNEACEKHLELTREEALALFTRRLNFMKNYNYVFDIEDERLAEHEKSIAELATGFEKSRQLDEEVRILEQRLEFAYAELDEELADYHERTGKRPVLTRLPDKKVHKGN